MTLDDILRTSSLLLAPQGRLFLILPAAREAELFATMEKYGMAFTKKCLVRTAERKAPSRLLVEISRQAICPEASGRAVQISATSTLTIGSEEFRKLTGDYYL